ncbi:MULTISPECIES: helix-turn-helix transcriptional regulator [Halocynthiibacter]|uniref:YafY family transcriptional regulator n=1 Tax=Halocynthiibacter halioticoli TaxID=2986804 RepID=A0AAE3IWF3_9RHOB|nr:MULTISPECIES: YafY family protein [Halocynthiibacter]MCV6823390.1 YafY family transcriptional regulator [Halocynthiibacter halioticoli]MCW4056391.1 YafY family transcriptional regulator [Halocynthiibacter sp. SDUM655004]
MRRADRLFQIVQYLRGGRLLTAHVLAERLEVSERTIYRDIADLIGSGVPIDGEAGVGYLMREGYDLPPLMFNTQEITALVAGARMLRAWGGASMALAAEEALAKIEAVLPDDARKEAENVQIFAPNPFWFTDEERAQIDRIEAAVNTRAKLEMLYETADGTRSTRVVRPLGLWFWGRVWTLVGWCELRNDFRMFRLDRILYLTEGAPFETERGKTMADFYRIEKCKPSP